MGKIDWNDKAAVKLYKHKRYEETSERQKFTARKWREEHPKEKLIYVARCRAKEGEEFTITTEDFDIPEFCPILGIRLTIAQGKGHGDYAASLDRLNSKLGYIKGNVQVISYRANRIKNNGTAEEHEKIAKFMRERGE